MHRITFAWVVAGILLGCGAIEEPTRLGTEHFDVMWVFTVYQADGATGDVPLRVGRCSGRWDYSTDRGQRIFNADISVTASADPMCEVRTFRVQGQLEAVLSGGTRCDASLVGTRCESTVGVTKTLTVHLSSSRSDLTGCRFVRPLDEGFGRDIIATISGGRLLAHFGGVYDCETAALSGRYRINGRGEGVRVS